MTALIVGAAGFVGGALGAIPLALKVRRLNREMTQMWASHARLRAYVARQMGGGEDR